MINNSANINTMKNYSTLIHRAHKDHEWAYLMKAMYRLVDSKYEHGRNTKRNVVGCTCIVKGNSYGYGV